MWVPNSTLCVSWRLDWNTGQFCFTGTPRSLHSRVSFSPTLFCGLCSYVVFHTFNSLPVHCLFSSSDSFPNSSQVFEAVGQMRQHQIWKISAMSSCSVPLGVGTAAGELMNPSFVHESSIRISWDFFLYSGCPGLAAGSFWLLQQAFLKRSEFLWRLNLDPFQVFHN